MAGHARYTAVLDACVLYSIAVTDALMSLATAGLFAAIAAFKRMRARRKKPESTPGEFADALANAGLVSTAERRQPSRPSLDHRPRRLPHRLRLHSAPHDPPSLAPAATGRAQRQGRRYLVARADPAGYCTRPCCASQMETCSTERSLGRQPGPGPVRVFCAASVTDGACPHPNQGDSIPTISVHPRTQTAQPNSAPCPKPDRAGR